MGVSGVLWDSAESPAEEPACHPMLGNILLLYIIIIR